MIATIKKKIKNSSLVTLGRAGLQPCEAEGAGKQRK
jgi:hypothetical protein